MKRDSYSDQQSRASFQPKSPQPAIEPTQFGQPAHHSSSTSDLGSNWLGKASGWAADKFQAAQNFVNGLGDAIAPDQILPALRGTASQSTQSSQPLVGVIDSGFGTDEHGGKMVEAIQKENPQAQIWKGGGVGTGDWSESLVEFVDTAKASGHSRAVANLSFDLTEVHPDGSTSNRSRLTADEQSALAYARDNDVLIVASSGNQGGTMSALGAASQPSDNLIVVGAANGPDRASYSSYGKGLDLVAEAGSAGTSLAAANVTSTIAQMWSDNPGLSDRQINQTLTATSTDLNKQGWDAETGSGLLNTKGAIDLATHTTPEPIVLSGAQLIQHVSESESLDGATWESRDGAVATERTNRLMEGDGPRSPAQPTSPQRAFELHRQGERAFLSHPRPAQSPPAPAPNLLDVAESEFAAPRPNLLDVAESEFAAPRPNLLDVAKSELAESPPSMEQPNPTPGQLTIRQGDTLWDVAQERLGSGDRWRELRKPDGSPFTEQEASRLQVGTSVQIPGAQPNPIPTQQPPAPVPPPAPPPPAPAPDSVGDFFNGAGSALSETVEGAVETVTNPLQTVNDLVDLGHVIVNDPGQAWDSLIQPYTDAFNNGRPWEAIGRLAVDVGSSFIPGAGVGARITNGLRRLRGALPDSTPATIPSSSSTLPEPPVTIPSPSSTPTDLTPAPTLNSPALPPPAPDRIASIPDDFGNALREMGDGETLDNPSPSVLPAPQAGSLGNGDNIMLQNPLTDGGGSPSSSGSELADLNVSRPPAADNYDRQLVTVGARDLEQTPSSTDRSTADSRNYEPVAVGGVNGGTRPSDPSTAAATTSTDSPWSPPPAEMPDLTPHIHDTRDLKYVQDTGILLRLHEIRPGESLSQFAERIKPRIWDKNGVELTNSNQAQMPENTGGTPRDELEASPRSSESGTEPSQERPASDGGEPSSSSSSLNNLNPYPSFEERIAPKGFELLDAQGMGRRITEHRQRSGTAHPFERFGTYDKATGNFTLNPNLGLNQIAVHRTRDIAWRPEGVAGNTWPSLYREKGDVTTKDAAKPRGNFRSEAVDVMWKKIVDYRQRTGKEHPFEQLVKYDAKEGRFKLSKGVDAGHITSAHRGGPDMLAIESQGPNRRDGATREKRGEILRKRVIEIDGVPFELETAQRLFPDLVENAPSHPGWRGGERIIDRYREPRNPLS